MEDYPSAILLNYAEHCDPGPITDEVQSLTKESILISGTGTGISSSTETGASSECSCSEDASIDNGSRIIDASNREKRLSKSKELVPSHHVSAFSNHDDSFRDRNSGTASTSSKEQNSSDPVAINVSTELSAVMDIDNSVNRGMSQICPESLHRSSSSPQEIEHSLSDGVAFENDVPVISNSGSVSVISDSSINFPSLRDESLQEAVPSDLEYLVSNRERSRRDGSVLLVDVVSISSSILSSNNADIGNREARRNSRRLFWDAFSRRSSRRSSDSPAIVFSTDDTDDLGSHDRWLLDFSGDFFNDGLRGDSGYSDTISHNMSERQRQSRSEIWERLRGGIDDSGRRTTICSSGLHPSGTCSCESLLLAEESSTRASISRIVMLAEALFEVLDEIHRQPVSLSLSMVSLPAPESVVNSFPLKNHQKLQTVGSGDDVEQCYICLAEYEEGDKIRVLPCRHEYHMLCVDKWLKEIHGICPLCRADVREGVTVCSVSNPENP